MQVFEQRVAAVLGRFDDRGVDLRRDRETVRSADPGLAQDVDRARDLGGVPVGVALERDRIVRPDLDEPVDAGVGIAVEDGTVLGARQYRRRLVERRQVEVAGAAVGVLELATATT